MLGARKVFVWEQREVTRGDDTGRASIAKLQCLLIWKHTCEINCFIQLIFDNNNQTTVFLTGKKKIPFNFILTRSEKHTIGFFVVVVFYFCFVLFCQEFLSVLRSCTEFYMLIFNLAIVLNTLISEIL